MGRRRKKTCYILFPENEQRGESAEIALNCFLRTMVVLCNGLLWSMSRSFSLQD